MKRPLLIGTVILASLGWAGPAHAGEGGYAYVNGSTLYFLADLGDDNDVTIEQSGDLYAVDDSQPFEPGPGCIRVGSDDTYAVCTAIAGITTIRVDTHDLNDDVQIVGPTPSIIHGGAGIDQLIAGDGNSQLFGGPGNDVLIGWEGDDWLVGGTGRDWLYGYGGDRDTVSYQDSPVGVVADFDGVADDGAPGENDVFADGIEILVGSPFNDTLRGGTGDDEIYGNAGHDVIYGLPGDDLLFGDGPTRSGVIGADMLFGGPGGDMVSYDDHTAAQRVFADLDGAIGDDGAAGEGDTIGSDVEYLTGSPGNDFLTGDGEYNWFAGGDGNDVITGLGGDDVAHGQEGHDSLYGGDGNDIVRGGNGNDTVWGQRGSDFVDGGNGFDNCDDTPEDYDVRNCP